MKKDPIFEYFIYLREKQFEMKRQIYQILSNTPNSQLLSPTGREEFETVTTDHRGTLRHFMPSRSTDNGY